MSSETPNNEMNLELLKQRFTEQLALTVPSPVQKSIFTFSELYEAKDEDQKFIIPELIPAYAVTMFIGEDGIGKTQLLTQLCLHCGFKKKSFLGMKLNVQHGNALIIATEDSRLKWIRAAARQADVIEPGFDPKKVGIKFMEASIFDEFIHLQESIEAELKKTNYDIVVADAFSDLFTLIDGEINSNSHARRLLSFLQSLCEKYTTTIIVIHHAAKTKVVHKQREGKIFIEKNDAQGAGAITQKPRTVLALSNDPKSIEEDGAKFTNYLHVVKANLMGKTYLQNAVQLQFTTKDLLHRAKGLVDIQLMMQAPVESPNEKRKNFPKEYSDKQHHDILAIIFRESLQLTRDELIKGMVAHYLIGKTKVESALDKGGFLAYLLEKGFIKKVDMWFKYLPQKMQELARAEQAKIPLVDNPDEEIEGF